MSGSTQRYLGPSYADDTAANARYGGKFGGEVYYDFTLNIYKQWSVSASAWVPLSRDEDLTAAIAVRTSNADQNKMVKTDTNGWLSKTLLKFPANSYASDSAAATAYGTLSGGEFYYNTTDNAYKFYNGTTWTTLNAGSISLTLNDLTDVDTAGVADGDVLTYDSGTGTWIADAPTGGSGDGDRNFILNGKAEIDAAGWTTYADAAGTRPVDGTGGVANVTFTRSTTSPLDEIASFIFTKDAANRQGQGADYDFTIDAAYRAKVLTIEFDYLVSSGTFVAGSSTTDSDVICYIYNVTDGVLVEPSSFKLLSNSTTISDKFQATFQTSATASTYRLIFHVASTSTAAYSLKIDNIKVSPSRYIFGAPISDETVITPTVTYATGGATNVTWLLSYMRVGQRAVGQIKATWTGASAAFTTPRVTLPFSVDATGIYGDANGAKIVGKVNYADLSTANYESVITLFSSNQVVFNVSNTSGGTLTFGAAVSQGTPFTLANGDTWTANFDVKVLGWSSSTQMSDSTDTRVVAARAAVTSPVATTALQPIPLQAITYDTHGAITSGSGWRYTARVRGFYNVHVVGFTSGTSTNFVLYKNGISYGNLFLTSTPAAGGSQGVELNVGEYVDVRTDANATINGCQISIERISGPSAISQTESIIASYGSSSGQSIGSSSTIVDYATRIKDTHNAVTTGASWRFTAPAQGTYKVSLAFLWSAAVYAVGNNTYFEIYKNSSLYRRIAGTGAQTTSSVFLQGYGSASVEMNAGDFIDLRAVNERGATTLFSNTAFNYVDIERLK